MLILRTQAKVIQTAKKFLMMTRSTEMVVKVKKINLMMKPVKVQKRTQLNKTQKAIKKTNLTQVAMMLPKTKAMINKPKKISLTRLLNQIRIVTNQKSLFMKIRIRRILITP